MQEGPHCLVLSLGVSDFGIERVDVRPQSEDPGVGQAEQQLEDGLPLGIAVGLLAVRNVVIDLRLRNVQVGEDIREGDPGARVGAGSGAGGGPHFIRQAHRRHKERAQAWLSPVGPVVRQPLPGGHIGDARGAALASFQAPRDAQAGRAHSDIDGDVVDVIFGNRREQPIAAKTVFDQLQQRCLADAGRPGQNR